MNDILFGNNNSKVITKLSKRYFKKNKVRNLAALLAIILTAFLFTSITSLAFNMASSIQLSLQMQKGSKADGTLGYMTEEQYEQLVNSDFVEQAGHRRIIGYAGCSSIRPAADDWHFHTPDQGHCEPSGNLAHADWATHRSDRRFFCRLGAASYRDRDH